MGTRVPKGSQRQVRGAHETQHLQNRAGGTRLAAVPHVVAGDRPRRSDLHENRSAFEWPFTYENGVILLSAQGERLRAEFMHIPKTGFAVTGFENEDNEAKEFTGTEIRRNWQRNAVALHQAKSASGLPEKHDLAGAHLQPMPHAA